MFVLKHLIGRILGFVIYSYLIGKHGYYRGQQIMYQRMQAQRCSFLNKILKNYIENPLQESALFLKRNLDFYKNNIDSCRLSTKVIEEYSDDSLAGYGDVDFKCGGDTIEGQQRGQILALLTTYLSSLNNNETICEIGCGNGDVIAFLAKKFPNLNFIGIDFSIKNSEAKHNLPNLHFKKGYALDMLENGAIKTNVVYASSTICVFNPKELSYYIKLFKDNNITNILFNEPTWGAHNFNDQEYSVHLEGAVWHHDYEKYFKLMGYQRVFMEKRNYLHPKSSRPDIVLNIAHYAS